MLEIEVESLEELKLALDGKAQVIMLDNFSLEDMVEAKSMRDIHSNQAKLESSGNVSIDTINDNPIRGLLNEKNTYIIYGSCCFINKCTSWI